MEKEYLQHEYLSDTETLMQRLCLRVDELQTEIIDKEQFIREVVEHIDLFVDCRDKFLQQRKAKFENYEPTQKLPRL